MTAGSPEQVGAAVFAAQDSRGKSLFSALMLFTGGKQKNGSVLLRSQLWNSPNHHHR